MLMYLQAERSGSSQSSLCETEILVSAVSRPSPVSDRDFTWEAVAAGGRGQGNQQLTTRLREC